MSPKPKIGPLFDGIVGLRREGEAGKPPVDCREAAAVSPTATNQRRSR